MRNYHSRILDKHSRTLALEGANAKGSVVAILLDKDRNPAIMIMKNFRQELDSAHLTPFSTLS